MEKLTAAMPWVYLPLSSALFCSSSADLHLPVVLVLHLRTKVPPAQKSGFYSASKVQNTRTLMPSRHCVYPKTRAKESVILISFQTQRLGSKQAK